mmetsp:Transcript_7328/g.11591  ORF Transcript_7328/g.11591 Transcript_7328/m.11591 type:complete len:647 (+) Transcript_7328:221-2161(+)
MVSQRVYLIVILENKALLEFIFDIWRHKVVVGKLHGVVGSAFTHRSQSGDVLEHVGERNLSTDSLHITTFTEFTDNTTTRVDVPKDISHVFFRCRDIDLHQRFHKTGLCLSQTFSGGSPSGNLEGHYRRINVVVCSIDKGGFHTKDRESSNNSLSKDGLNSLLNTRNVFLRNTSTLDVRSKLKVHGSFFLAELLGFEDDFDTCVLTRSSRLLLVCVVNLSSRCNGFTVRHLWCTDIALNVEFTFHTVNNDLKVKFTHTFDDGLSGLFVTRESERRIFCGKTNKSFRHFLLISLGLWFHSNFDDRLREFHLLQDYGLFLGAESLSGSSVFKTDKCNNVTGNSRLDFSTVVGVHLKHTSDSFVLPFDRVVDGTSGFQNTRIDTSESQRTNKRVIGNLESQGRHWFSVRRLSLGWFTGLCDSGNSQNVEGGRHVIDNGIQQRLNTLVLKRGSSQNRDQIQTQSSLSNESFQCWDIWHFSFKVLHENLFVLLNSKLDKFLVVFGCLGLEFVVYQWDVVAFIERNDVETGTKILSTPNNSLHSHKVNDSQEISFSTNRKLKNSWRGPKQIDDSVDAEVKVGSGTVHFVKETHARNLVLICLTPDSLSLGFNTCDTIEDSDGSIQNSKRSLHFQSKVDVTGGVNNVDSMVLP